jgi:serine/threonine-protein kinase HipA
MARVSRTAYVYVRDTYAGVLEDTDEGFVFRYDELYLADSESVPVSLTIPKRKESYESKTLFPFFDGLIPEGWLLNIVVDNWKIDPRDRFGLLLHACRDCIGAVSIRDKKE